MYNGVVTIIFFRTKGKKIMEKRSTFTGSLGFILAAASSAIGLGNIWRFPYLAAKYGGGAFLLVYILLVITFGFTLMLAENAIGRKTGKSALCAFGELSKKWKFLGVIATIVPAVILPYYNVIGGWVINFAVEYLSGNAAGLAADYNGLTFFETMVGNPTKLLIALYIYILANTIIILCGVQKGIERISKILMPVLLFLAIGISIYSVTLPGAIKGLEYLFVPKLENFSLQGVLAAMGQMFYSLSLAMGIMITYGSYLPKESNLEKSVSRIEIFDTAIAILAGLMIIPAVFAFSNGDPAALNKGPGLMFITLPKVFESTGAGMATVIGTAFFLLVLFAALTSSMSLMETLVSSVCDHFKMGRKKSTILVAIFSAVVGTFPALGYNVLSGVKFGKFDILDSMDFISNSVLMPITALLTCIFIAYVVGVKVVKDEVELSGKFKREKLFNVMIKYIAPIFTVAILIFALLEAMGVLTV